MVGHEQLGNATGGVGIADRGQLLLLISNLPRSASEQTRAIDKTFAEVEWITIFFFIIASKARIMPFGSCSNMTFTNSR